MKHTPFTRDIVSIEKDDIAGRLHEAMVDDNGKVALIFMEDTNIDGIIKCVNMHNELVEMLENVKYAYEHGFNKPAGSDLPKLEMLIKKAKEK